MSRYIDADALIEFIDSGHYRNPSELCFSEQDVVDMIESRPTADVRENIHGEWIQAKELGSYIYMCSKCGETWDTFSGVMPLPNFCPECGTDMREEERDVCGLSSRSEFEGKDTLCLPEGI